MEDFDSTDKDEVIAWLVILGSICMSTGIGMLFGEAYGWLTFGSICLIGVVVAVMNNKG